MSARRATVRRRRPNCARTPPSRRYCCGVAHGVTAWRIRPRRICASDQRSHISSPCQSASGLVCSRANRPALPVSVSVPAADLSDLEEALELYPKLTRISHGTQMIVEPNMMASTDRLSSRAAPRPPLTQLGLSQTAEEYEPPRLPFAGGCGCDGPFSRDVPNERRQAGGCSTGTEESPPASRPEHFL